MVEPKLAKSNAQGNLIVLGYSSFFLILKLTQTMQLIDTIYEIITDCYFWENLIFYITETSIKMVSVDVLTSGII